MDSAKAGSIRMELTSRNIAICGIIAAVYTAICVVIPFISYGPLQVRVAEALTILAVMSPIGIWGVTLGCALANMYGWMTGVNLLGYMDIFFGTAASFIAAVMSWHLRHLRFMGLPLASTIPPVLVNALIIGAQIAFVYNMPFYAAAFSVMIGQLVACVGMGLMLFKALERRNITIR